jgi:hypothetical protein
VISYDAVSDVDVVSSDRVWTVPNLLSLLRLLGVPLFLWLAVAVPAHDVARPLAWAFAGWGVALYRWPRWLYFARFRPLTRSTAPLVAGSTT